MALRIRHELVDPFQDKISVWLKTAGAGRVRDSMTTVFLNIVTEGESRGIVTVSDLVAAFSKEEDRLLVMAMLKLWPDIEKKLWRALGLSERRAAWSGPKSNVDFSDSEIQTAEEALAELGKMNATFLRLAFRRLAEQANDQFKSIWSPPSLQTSEDTNSAVPTDTPRRIS
jgi:hypothetical protein